MFGVALSVKSRAYACTPALFNQVIDDPHTASVCADISDALERVRRGEMSREDFETYKSRQKKLLPVFTPHASYRDGRRQNDEAIPSGLSMYDIDHISDPRGYFQRIVAERCGELGIPFAHVTPSTEGLRLFFVVPEGMSLAEAQKWMSEQLGDENYDGKVKDLARSSFVVPRDYVLYLDEEELFKDRQVTWDIRQGTHHAPAPPSAAPSRTEAPATPSGEPPSDGQGSASARNLRAFDLCLKEAGLSRAKIDKVGIYDCVISKFKLTFFS